MSHLLGIPTLASSLGARSLILKLPGVSKYLRINVQVPVVWGSNYIRKDDLQRPTRTTRQPRVPWCHRSLVLTVSMFTGGPLVNLFSCKFSHQLLGDSSDDAKTKLHASIQLQLSC